MTETRETITGGRSDRKLGDEWADWKDDKARENEIDERLTTFFALSAVVMLIFLCLFPVMWYLIKPRILLINPFLARAVEWTLTVFIAAFMVLFLAEGLAILKFGRSFFPYKMMEGLLLSILPKTVWLGEKFGISRDRVGNSFIKIHNFITRSHVEKLNPGRLLVLLPRCLKKEARGCILDMVKGSDAQVLTVAGGEEAREAIRRHRPSFIVALACERDLMSGIKDVAEKVPVLAIPNKRPEGPCKNTDFSLREFEETLLFISKRKPVKSESQGS